MLSLKKRLKNLLLFLMFREGEPSVHVCDTIPILLLAVLSIVTFVLGLLAFYVMIEFGFAWFFVYYLGLMVIMLETVHVLTTLKAREGR